MRETGAERRDAWSAVIGQEEAVGRLKRAVETASVSHAYLLYGPSGVGKRALALAFACALNCADGGCGVCPSCRKILSGNHPDVSIVVPGGNHLSIEQIREMGSLVHLKPFEGSRKVYILELVNTMTPEAANAFLKGLEEPPARVVFVLTAPGLEGVMPTIVSRCQPVPLRPTSKARIAEALRVRYGTSDSDAALIAGLSGGVLGRALELAGDEDALQSRIKLLRLLGQVKERSAPGLVELKGDLLTAAGGDVDLILRIFLSFARDALVLKETSAEALVVNFDQRAELAAFAGQAETADLVGVVEAIQRAERGLRYNVNKDLTLEEMLLSVHNHLSAPTGVK